MGPEITMRAALNRIAKSGGAVVWYLENAEHSHRLPGLAYLTKEGAESAAHERGFPHYCPAPYLKSKAVERRWATGRGRAGGDVLKANAFWMITPIRAIGAKASGSKAVQS